MADNYRFLSDVYHGRESYAIHAASGVEAGDMMQWDDQSRVATSALLTSGSIFLGISEESNPLVGLGSASAPLTGARMRVLSQGVFELVTTNGETYSHLEPVYQGADAQRVTKVAATRLVGRVHLPDGTQVTGDGTNKVNIRILGSMTNAVAPSGATGDR